MTPEDIAEQVFGAVSAYIDKRLQPNDDSPLIVALGRILKSELHTRDTRIAELEARIKAIENARTLEVERRLLALEQAAPRLRMAAGV